MKTYLITGLSPEDKAKLQVVSTISLFSKDDSRAAILAEKPPGMGTLLETIEGNMLAYVADIHLKSSPLEDLFRQAVASPVSPAKKLEAVDIWVRSNDRVKELEAAIAKERITRHEACVRIATCFGKPGFVLHGTKCIIGTRRGGSYCVMSFNPHGRAVSLETDDKPSEEPSSAPADVASGAVTAPATVEAPKATAGKATAGKSAWPGTIWRREPSSAPADVASGAVTAPATVEAPKATAGKATAGKSAKTTPAPTKAAPAVKKGKKAHKSPTSGVVRARKYSGRAGARWARES